MGYEQSPCPTARSLENLFYPTADSILRECAKLIYINSPLPTLSIFRKLPLLRTLLVDYFAKQQVDDSCLNEALRTVDKSVRNFYSKNSLKDNSTRLHNSTLGPDELLAFCTAFLEGNITVGLYNDSYQKLAANIFNSSYAVILIQVLLQIFLLYLHLYNWASRSGDRVIVPVFVWSTTVFRFNMVLYLYM